MGFVGFIMGLLFGALGLIGGFFCRDSEDRKNYMCGWVLAFIINFIATVILVFAVFGGA